MSRRAKAKQILATIERMKVVLQLERWDLHVQIVPARADTSPEPSQQMAAGCHASPQYQHAELLFALDEILDEDIDATVIHELCHALVWDQVALIDQLTKELITRTPDIKPALELLAEGAVERVATRLDRIFCSLLLDKPPQK